MSKQLYPFEGKFLAVGPGGVHSHKLHYLDEGAHSPSPTLPSRNVVMVHGNPTWSFYFRNMVFGLSQQHRCIVPDHIGCGRSDKPGLDLYPYTLERRVSDLEQLIDQVVPAGQPLTLMLHDWGGMIGMAYASQHPQRVERLILLNTGGFRLPQSKPLPRSIWWCRNTPLGPFLVRGLNAFCRGAARYCVTRRPLQPEVQAAYLAPHNSWRNRLSVLRFVQDIPLQPDDAGYDIVEGVERGLSERFAETPTLICWGDRDFVFDEHFLRRWTELLPQAQVHRFADAGHYILEDAGEEILPLVHEFLQQPPNHAPGAP